MRCKLIAIQLVTGIKQDIIGRTQDVCKSYGDITSTLFRPKIIYEKILRFPSVEKVVYVISNTTNGCVNEAVKCTYLFDCEGNSTLFTTFSNWDFGSEEMNSDPLTLIKDWMINGSEFQRTVYNLLVFRGIT